MVMSRFQSIGQPVEPFQGTWIPVWGFYAPVVAMVLGLAALGWLCLVAPGRARAGEGDGRGADGGGVDKLDDRDGLRATMGA
jgi:hypothetical protein